MKRSVLLSLVRSALAPAPLFAVLLLSAAPQHAFAKATITVSSLPGDTPGDLFDVSNPGNTYSLGPSTTLNSSGYDARDIFGGELDPYAPERGNVIFGDNQPIGTVETVNVTLPSPVAITNYNLWVSEDGDASGHRSTREFELFAGSTLIDDVQILNTTGTQTFTAQYGGPNIEISDTLTGVPASSTYTLDFIQNQAAGPVSGLRVNEFDAYNNVPEPGSFTLLGVASLGLLTRKPRRML
jgi:hypothetical protein